MLARIAALLSLSSLGVALVGCAAPTQNGEVHVLPGASERFELAMRMGYLGGFEREMVPGQVRRVAFTDQLPTGPARSGKVGDYVLENGHFIATVTNVDGSARGGRLTDISRKPKSDDGLGGVTLTVFGKAVVYDSLTTGYDEATRASFVEVSGVLDFAEASGPKLTVSTRYDAAPGVDGVLAHTHVKVERAASSAEWNVAEGHPLLVETMAAHVAKQSILLGDEGDFGAVIGASGGTFMRPLGQGRIERTESTGESAGVGAELAWRVPGSVLPNEGGAVVLTRMFGALERPDTAALAVAVAKSSGEAIGDVEIRFARFAPGASPTQHGDLYFRDATGRVVARCDARTTGVDAHFAVSLPAGTYDVVVRSPKIVSVAATFEIEGDRTQFLGVDAVPPRPGATPFATDACEKERAAR